MNADRRPKTEDWGPMTEDNPAPVLWSCHRFVPAGWPVAFLVPCPSVRLLSSAAALCFCHPTAV